MSPLAANLARDHLVIVPDLRGMGLSDHPASGYDKKTEGQDIAGVLNALHVGQVEVVGHDIGNMVAYAFTAEHRDRVTRLVLMEAPLPGVGPWDEILKSPLLWHFLLKPLPTGSFYTEPAGEPHFARTGNQAVTVYISGFGPTDTHYVNAAADPSHP